MHIQFSYNRHDVINALRSHFMRRGEIKVFRNTFAILLLATIAGYVFNLVSVSAVMGILVMILLIGSVFWFLLPISIYNKSNTFKESIRLGYNEHQMTIGTEIGDRPLSWSNFSQIVETPTFFFLYRDKKSFFLVPLSAFRTENEIDDFRELLKNKFDSYQVAR
ncbi:YcxB family protein [Chitinophaga horti]|uniref:YcxB family protein n=1 Tax=Chitinophaga horti TaxID=2920382 RepID=A0ABY6J3E6_9BACT|nr:YcxB family protein [Chitinophaga horti]UYQ93157.1 YcxB family protein [Chitinophaga horti]